MGSVHSISTNAELERFFNFMFEDETGYVYSPTKDPDTGNFQQYYFEWPTEKEALIGHINKYTATREVYYGPALFKAPNAEKEDFKGTHFVWAEFDGSLPDSIDGIPEPTIKIQSSTDNHEHWYWRLENFVTDITVVETISQRLAYKLQADLSCWNANRVLRPPTTTHHESTRVVQVLKMDSEPVSIRSFVDLPEIPVKMLVGSDIGYIPQIIEVIAKYAWDTDNFTFFNTPTIEEGHRSSALTKLSHICMEMGMSNAETLAVLFHADHRWKKFVNRKDRKERLLGIINYCRARHPVDVVAEEVQAVAEDRLRIYTFDEFRDTKLTVDWAVPGLIHKKGLAIIAGPPGIGKSQMTLRIVERLAKGEKFLKWVPEKPMKCLFISMEMPHEELYKVMDDMKIGGDAELLRENFLIMPIGSSIQLTKPSTQDMLKRKLDEFQPDGVFLDSLGVAVGSELSSDTVILENFDWVKREIQNDGGAFAWWIHHPRKAQIGNKKPTKLDDLYGSQYIGAGVTTAIGLWPAGPHIEVNCLKLRLSEPFKTFRVQRTPNLDFTPLENEAISSDTPILSNFGIDPAGDLGDLGDTI